MTDVVIRAENLGKKYRIEHQSEKQRYQTLRDTLTNHVKSLFRNPRASLRNSGSAEDFWALQDVSFEVRRGDVIGVIGRNGAGKSTLLKILSRITEPTKGRVGIKGRVASLLEVGTGFHPELTGRENIYLNGAILGMALKEIKQKFDEIVAFAEVERFIDTPVKRYSSGMYVRLAFAVAAYLDPDILLVDEVLAVGDARFQRKCLEKMQDVGQQGRTVFFVSHNISAITRLCPQAILLEGGALLEKGISHQVVNTYLGAGLGTMAVREWRDLNRAPGNDVVRLCALRVRTGEGQIIDAIDIRESVGIEMDYEVLKPNCVFLPNLHLFNETGVNVFISIDHDQVWRTQARPIGRYTSTMWIPGNFLSEGRFVIAAAATTMNPFMVHFHEPDTVAFQVIDSCDGSSARGDYAGPMPGVIRPILEWDTQYNTSYI